MKKIFCILLFLLPFLVPAQQPWYKIAPVDYKWMYVGDTVFSEYRAGYISLDFSPSGEPFVAYEDFRYGGNASVMKFNGINWENVGNAGFSAGAATYTSIAVSSSGQPYVAYLDYADSGKATVMKFDGINWVNVGSAGFSQGSALYESLAISPSDGQPYVAFQPGKIDKTTVMKFDGTNWINVGNTGVVDYPVIPSLAFNASDGQPYVAFADDSLNWKVTVMRFNGINWVYVGSPGFSTIRANWVDLKFNPIDSQPYVVFIDNSNSSNPVPVVMKFNGTSWVTIGNAGFSSGGVWYTSLAFSQSGQPYVAFTDHSLDDNVTVMKFNGTNWVNVGNAGFSGKGTECVSLAISPSGQPYVAFQETYNKQRASVMKYDSAIGGINMLKEERLFLYPNPTSKSLIIDLMSFLGNLLSIEINDIKGIRMYEIQTRKNRIVINIENYPNGVYFVNLKTATSNYFGKFCKD